MKHLAGISALFMSLAFSAQSAALAQTRIDVGGTVVSGVYDVSNATRSPAYCQVTVTSSAATLASLLAAAGCGALPAWATSAFLTPESSLQIALRYRTDGVAPTASSGQPVLGWQSWPLQGLSGLSNASLISATGSNVTVDVEIRG